MAKGDFDLIARGDLNATKEAVDDLLEKMGFTVSYSGMFDATAQRGSGLKTAIAGPFAGKNNIAVKLGISYREGGGQTNVSISDEGSKLGKALTLTGGSTKKVVKDVYNTLREGLSRKGL